MIHVLLMQVMFAEPLGSRTRSTGDFTAESQGGLGSAGGYTMASQDGTLHLMQSPQVRGTGWWWAGRVGCELE